MAIAHSNHLWADKPLAMIPTPSFTTKKDDMWTAGASHMANVHNVIFRGYNSIYLQAMHVNDKDIRPFIEYCQSWLRFLECHTAEEEKGHFIMTEELLGENVFRSLEEEHESILVPLNDLSRYLSSLASPAEYSSDKLLELMTSLQKPLAHHFHSEVELIAKLARHPKTPKPSSSEEAKIIARFDKWGANSILASGLSDGVVFFLLNLDLDYEEGLWKHWPPIPAPVRWAVINLLGMIRSDRWKFASCDHAGKLRPLYALE